MALVSLEIVPNSTTLTLSGVEGPVKDNVNTTQLLGPCPQVGVMVRRIDHVYMCTVFWIVAHIPLKVLFWETMFTCIFDILLTSFPVSMKT